MKDTIKTLYPYALAEGEGVGTAYEYIAKADFIRPLISRLSDRARHADGGEGARVLVAGLPEKYGTSLDFTILAHRHQARLTIVDDRQPAIDRAQKGIDAVQRAGYLQGLRVEYRRLESLAELSEIEPHEVVLSCEVLQRVPPSARAGFVSRLRSLGPIGALFVPNAENASHLAISGLSGFSRREIEVLFTGARSGYVDMPPFPPGIARSSEQRTRASSGMAEAVAMRILDVYCSGERIVPTFVKRRFAHIVCTMWGV
jgi:2-polyprenyl-3-methyl-5-hydroxy-6-metoxy-1,4-benzoquinol methylase